MRYQQARSNSAGRAPNPARPVSGAFTLDLDKIEGRMERLSDSGPKLVEHDLDDIINSDPVMLPITRTGLQQRVGSPESAGNRLIHYQEAHQVQFYGNYTTGYFQPLIFQAVNAVIAKIFSTDTNVSITALGQLDELIKDNEKVVVFVFFIRLVFFLSRSSYLVPALIICSACAVCSTGMYYRWVHLERFSFWY